MPVAWRVAEGAPYNWGPLVLWLQSLSGSGEGSRSSHSLTAVKARGNCWDVDQSVCEGPEGADSEGDSWLSSASQLLPLRQFERLPPLIHHSHLFHCALFNGHPRCLVHVVLRGQAPLRNQGGRSQGCIYIWHESKLPARRPGVQALDSWLAATGCCCHDMLYVFSKAPYHKKVSGYFSCYCMIA